MSHEATIRNLDQEQNRLKEKISRLEEEREALLNQSQVANEQHKQQVHKLEQVTEGGESLSWWRHRGFYKLTGSNSYSCRHSGELYETQRVMEPEKLQTDGVFWLSTSLE